MINNNIPAIFNAETGELLEGDTALQFAAEHGIDVGTMDSDTDVDVFLDFDPTKLPKPNSRTEFVSFMQDWFDYISVVNDGIDGRLDSVLLKKWWKNYGKNKEALPLHKYPILGITKRITQGIASIIPMTPNEQLGMESIVNEWFFA